MTIYLLLMDDFDPRIFVAAFATREAAEQERDSKSDPSDYYVEEYELELS